MDDRDYYIFEDTVRNPELELVFEACVKSVFDDNIVTKKIGKPGYVMPLCIKGGDGYVVAEDVLAYYLAYQNRTGFDFEKAQEFAERMRIRFGFSQSSMIGYKLRQWVNLCLRDTWFYDENEEANSKKTRVTSRDQNYVLKPGMDYSVISEDVFKFACYVAVAHLKYGQSFDSITANQIFGYVTALGSDIPARMKKDGSGELPKEITNYKDDEVSCKANDAFGTIRITVKNENWINYEKVLVFMIKLLKTNFPKSYEIDFRSPDKNYLPIKGLPKIGVNQLFANAVKYPDNHDLIEEYAHLAMKRDEWYTNLEGENCALPGTFAVFALGLLKEDSWGESYTPLILEYLDTCDDEHSSIQNKFIASYTEKFGFTPDTIKVE
jgi:hypothetical protein